MAAICGEKTIGRAEEALTNLQLGVAESLRADNCVARCRGKAADRLDKAIGGNWETGLKANDRAFRLSLLIGDDEASLCAAACAQKAGAKVAIGALVEIEKKKQTVGALPSVPNFIWRRLDLQDYRIDARQRQRACHSV